jgi:hypothetical protein
VHLDRLAVPAGPVTDARVPRSDTVRPLTSRSRPVPSASRPLAVPLASMTAPRRPAADAHAPMISPFGSLISTPRPLTRHFTPLMITTLPRRARPPPLTERNRSTPDRFVPTRDRSASSAEHFLRPQNRSHSATVTDARGGRCRSRVPLPFHTLAEQKHAITTRCCSYGDATRSTLRRGEHSVVSMTRTPCPTRRARPVRLPAHDARDTVTALQVTASPLHKRFFHM